MKHLSVKLGNALGEALGSAGSDTSATLALLIIGFHALGHDISEFRADAYRALSSESLEPQIAKRLQQIINGITPLAYGSHTPVIQQSHEHVTFESEQKTSFPSVFDDEPEDDEDPYSVGISI